MKIYLAFIVYEDLGSCEGGFIRIIFQREHFYRFPSTSDQNCVDSEVGQKWISSFSVFDKFLPGVINCKLLERACLVITLEKEQKKGRALWDFWRRDPLRQKPTWPQYENPGFQNARPTVLLEVVGY